MIDFRKWNIKVYASKLELLDAIKAIVAEVVNDPFEIIADGQDFAIKTADGIMYLKDEECFIEHKDEFVLVPTRIRELAELYEGADDNDWEEE